MSRAKKISKAKAKFADAGPHTWGHIYAQGSQHSPAQISGTREFLLELREAIDEALRTNRSASTDSLFTSDGEGYRAIIAPMGEKAAQRQGTLPYYETAVLNYAAWEAENDE